MVSPKCLFMLMAHAAGSAGTAAGAGALAPLFVADAIDDNGNECGCNKCSNDDRGPIHTETSL